MRRVILSGVVIWGLMLGLIAPVASSPPPPVLGRAQVLVDAAWVAVNLSRADVRLIDLSSTREVYERGHLPGTPYLDWKVDLVDPTHRVAGMAPTRAQFQTLARRLGLRNTDVVVLYDDTSGLFASRAFWIFKLYRHERLAILDGGTRRWTQDGRPLVTEAPRLNPSAYVAPPRDDSILATAEYIVAQLGDKILCDARSPREYAGLDVRSAQGGRIPGAVNIEWTRAVNPDGTFRAVDELRALYARAGFSRDREVIVYCQTGVRAAHTWFVLKYLLGYPRVRNYDGSWEEWGNRRDLPIQR